MSSKTLLAGTALILLACSASATDLSRLPLRFEPSADGKAFVAGQVGCGVRVDARGLLLPGGIAITLAGADARAKPVPEDGPPGRSTYFVGDPAQWRRGVPQYRRVRFEGVYPGIDVVHHGDGGQLEHDFVVSPGADIGRIRFAVRGEHPALDASGDLVVGDVRVHAPIAWQDDDAGGRRLVACKFVPRGTRRFGFEVGEHDPARALIIDPIVAWSTYLGGSSESWVACVSAEEDGSTWLLGTTREGVDFPHQGATPVEAGMFLLRLSPAGDQLLASTFFGAGMPTRMARDQQGGIYIVGSAGPPGFPVVNALQDAIDGPSAFLMKLDATASTIIYSTYFGQRGIWGPHDIWGIAVDSSGRAIIAGSTSGTIPVVNALQPERADPPDAMGQRDGFVAKFAADGQSLVYSTYLGGTGDDEVADLGVDWMGNAIVVGRTWSEDFPTVNPCMAGDPSSQGAFVSRISPDGDAFVYSTTVGGAGLDRTACVAVGPLGDATVFLAVEGGGFPLLAPIEDRYIEGTVPLAAFKLSPTGVLERSTYLTTGGNALPIDATIDGWGRTTVVGSTTQDDFPIVGAPIPSHPASMGDAFVLRMAPDLASIDFSCRFGGNSGGHPNDDARAIAARTDGSVTVAGGTKAQDFPTTAGTLQAAMPSPVGLFPRIVGFATTFADDVQVREPSAINLRDVPPVVVQRQLDGPRLILGWEDTLGAKEGLYVGSIESLWRTRSYDHQSLVCDLGDAGGAVPMPPGNVYFLVVDRIMGIESSYGRDSFGRERPAALSPCQ